MTFKGSAAEDLSKILAAFPRDFKIKDVEAHFEWPTNRVKQALVMGQSTDVITVLYQPKNERGISDEAVYENLTWRKQWLTRAWRTHEPDMDCERQQHS
jgi:hypothetical protein